MKWRGRESVVFFEEIMEEETFVCRVEESSIEGVVIVTVKVYKTNCGTDMFSETEVVKVK